MEKITDYGTLKAAFTGEYGYFHRGDIDGMIPVFIQMAQARINRDLIDNPDMITLATVDIVAGDRIIALPTDIKKLLNIQVSTSGGRKALLQLTPHQMDEMYADTESGSPLHYAIYGKQIEVQPVTDGDATLEILYQYKLAEFSADTDTDALLTSNPMIYIYAVMLEYFFYSQADERMAVVQKLYDVELDSINTASEDLRYSGAPLQIISLGGSTP
jgi:hypothetical protein